MNTTKFLSPEAAEKAFYSAFESRNLDAMMHVWSDKNVLSCLHPDEEHLRSKNSIRNSWKDIFELASGGLTFHLKSLSKTQDENLAAHQIEEEVRVDGEIISIMITTNIYRREGNDWRLTLHHSTPEVTHQSTQKTTSNQDTETDDFNLLTGFDYTKFDHSQTNTTVLH